MAIEILRGILRSVQKASGEQKPLDRGIVKPKVIAP